MKKNVLLVLILVGSLLSCVPDEAENPPTTGADPNIEVTATIAELKSIYSGVAMELSDTLVISGIVVADDKSGNFHKSIVLQDATGGILIRMDENDLFNIYPVGRKLFIKLGGLWMGEYNGLIQLGGSKTIGTVDEVDPISSGLFDKTILRGTFNNEVIPLDVSLTSLNTSYQNMLIRLQDVQYVIGDTNKLYAPGSVSQSITLEDCAGNQIIVRTSGFASFANTPVENLNGELVCIYSEFGTTQQLILRDLNDVKMNGLRCGPYVRKDFEDGSITSGGWTTQQVIGPSVNWSTNTMGAQNGTYYAQCKNFLPPNVACETWLISPSFDLSAGINPALSFANAWKYSGTFLSVWVSTDYVSGLPSTGTWTNMTTAATWSSGNFVWASSGNVSLASYIGSSNVHIGFKYVGSASDGSTWEIDDIIVREL